MYVEYHIRDEAAKQLRDGIGTSIPVDPPGWSNEDRQKLRDVLYEINWADLMVAVHQAAERLNEEETHVSAEERSDDTKDSPKITAGGPVLFPEETQ